MKSTQLAQFIEQGIFNLDTITAQDVDWVLVGALFLVGQSDSAKALLALDRLIFKKPDVREALRAQMEVLLPQLEAGIRFGKSDQNKYSQSFICAVRMLGRVHGSSGRFLALSNDGMWAFPDPARRAATIALIADACKDPNFAADILLSVPAASIHNEDISNTVREHVIVTAAPLAMVRRAREGTSAMKDACHAVAADLKEHGQQAIRTFAGKIALSSDSKKFFSIPDYIQEVYLTDDYDTFLAQLKEMFQFTDEQVIRINDTILTVWTKELPVEKLATEIGTICALKDKRDQLCAREIVLNAVLLFPYHFGDQRELYRSLGGNPEKDASTSRLSVAAQKVFIDVAQKIYESMTIKDIEKERRDMAHLFQSTLVFHLYGEDPILPKLNTTILQLLNEIDGYAQELLNAMVKNEQKIGTLQANGAEPTVANWIKDFLSYSKGEGTSLTLAKYLTQSTVAPKLVDREREALRKLLNTYLVLKGFPNSILELSRDRWMVIPYQLSEEEAKTRERAMKIMSDALSQEEEESEAIPAPAVAERTQIPPTPTITIVEAPVVSAPVVVPAPVSMAKPVLPLKEKVTTPPVIPSEAQQSRGISVNPETTGTLPSVRDDVRIDFAVCAEAALAKAGVALGEDNRERVKNIIVTRLRNIRNAIDTKDRLCAPTAEGGTGLLPEDAEKLLQEAQNASKIIAEGKPQDYLPTKLVSGTISEEIEPDTNSQVKIEPDPTPPKMVIKEVGGVPMIVEKGEKKTNGKKKEEKTTELATELTQERGRTGSDPTPPHPPVPVPAHLEDAKDIPVVVTGKGSEGTTPSSGSLVGARDDKGNVRDDGKNVGADKKPIPDVKAPPRLVGPIDELRALTIKDIRRISEDPAVATQKIAEKINALGKESLSKKAEAINAWKGSPVYQLYLTVGQMNLGGDMAKIMDERKTGGKEYLTPKEFDALLDLNEKLRF